MGFVLNMPNCTTRAQANANDNLVKFKDLLAQRKQLFTEITQPRDELKLLLCDQYDLNGWQFSRIYKRIYELRRLITAQSHSHAWLDTIFRNNLADPPFLEINNVESAIKATCLYDMGLWDGSLCISTTLDPGLQDEMARSAVGLSIRFFRRNAQGAVEFQR
ncbi:hypothetical protein POM88_046351 [Heracleum sosnowskyi]|uniref:Uncharacterized protein n=1 Tax=Heracleum sosnowskyi TaxID=360622 RepID=A0AAD8M734_9APIA|nr:hypothetical protein POM88_046351 [Heracleum sosnowskyi]